MQSYRCIIWLCASAIISGCSAAQSHVYGPFPSLSGHTEADMSSANARSRASSERLLYVSSSVSGNVYVYSFPKASLIATLQTPDKNAQGECVDSSGDVFVTTINASGSGTIYEYAHGGGSPIATLSDPGWANGCAVDPTTGNLAVANLHDPGNPRNESGDLALYASAKGSPTMYYPSTSQYIGFDFDVYDAEGTLYLTAGDNYQGTTDLVRFSSAGSGSFQTIALSVKLHGASSVLWDGKHIAVSSNAARGQPLSLYRLQISGSTASIVGTSMLTSKKNSYSSQLWLQSRTVLGADYVGRGYQDVAFWIYPKGGAPYHSVRKVGYRAAELYGITVSSGSLVEANGI